MAIVVQPTATPLYTVDPAFNGKIEPLASLDISCHLKDPEYLGKFTEKELQHTYLAWLMASGNEMTKAGDQFWWKEAGYAFAPYDYVTNGLVTRVGNVFTLNPAAVVLDPNNIDNCKYTAADIAWGFEAKEEVLLIDATGKEEHGIVQSISADRKSATILSKDNAAFAIALTNIHVFPLGKNLDNCESPTCIGFRYKDVSYSNTMVRDSDCFTYCEEDLYNASMYERIVDEPGGSTYHRDRNLDEMQKRLWQNVDRKLFLGKQNQAGSAAETAGTFSAGMDGIIEQVKQRGYGWQGFIETEEDLQTIDDIQRRRLAPKDYIIHANSTQYRKLQTMLVNGMTATYDPFDVNADTMKHLGFKGIDIYGRNYFFQRWDMLDQTGTSVNMDKAYNFILTPQGDNKITYADGTSENVGYVTLIWKGKDGVVMKMRRYVTTQGLGAGKVKVEYANTFSVAVAQANHFVLGKPAF